MNDDEADDDECFYEMAELQPVLHKPTNTSQSDDAVTDEPSTPGDELDENFYQIDEEDTEDETIQPYIDEPFTPSDSANPNFHYSVLTRDEYIELMMKYVQEVKDILQLSSPIVKLLLHHFKWNKSLLLEKFYEVDQDEFFRQAKIINPFSQKTTAAQPTSTCLICYSDEQTNMFSLECQHVYCDDCWKSYLTNQIVDEGLGQTISCPEFECDILVDDETVFKLLADKDFVKHIYKRLTMNSLVANNPRARWCPGKNCGHIINATSLTSAYNYAQLITCDHCHTSFCFLCAHPWHDPIKCALLLKWNKKLIDDSETCVWIKANTKRCPKCLVNIEKNGGCNHMSCRNCNHQFCWLCFGNWSGHSECNRFNEADIADKFQAEYMLALTRYLHYYDRFRNHEHSLELESKLFDKVHQQLIRNEHQLSKKDTEIIDQAFDVLLQCRQTLTYTYPFAYYLVKNNQSIVFEQNQADLESACEQLSELLEKDLIKKRRLNRIKRNISEKYQYCSSRKNALIKHVKEGYSNGYWQYQDEKNN